MATEVEDSGDSGADKSKSCIPKAEVDAVSKVSESIAKTSASSSEGTGSGTQSMDVDPIISSGSKRPAIAAGLQSVEDIDPATAQEAGPSAVLTEAENSNPDEMTMASIKARLEAESLQQQNLFLTQIKHDRGEKDFVPDDEEDEF